MPLSWRQWRSWFSPATRPWVATSRPCSPASTGSSRVFETLRWREGQKLAPPHLERGEGGVMRSRRKIRRATKGQTMTEYALILATIAVVLTSLYTTAGNEVSTLVNKEGALF